MMWIVYIYIHMDHILCLCVPYQIFDLMSQSFSNNPTWVGPGVFLFFPRPTTSRIITPAGSGPIWIPWRRRLESDGMWWVEVTFLGGGRGEKILWSAKCSNKLFHSWRPLGPVYNASDSMIVEAYNIRSEQSKLSLFLIWIIYVSLYLQWSMFQLGVYI